jgi:hypothetical protein
MPINKQTKKMKNIIFLLFIIPLIGISQKKTQVIESDSIIIIDEYVTIDKEQIERYIQEDSIVTTIGDEQDTTYQTFQILVRQDITIDSLFREAIYTEISKRDARIEKGKRGLNRIQKKVIIPEREIIKELNRLIRISSNRGYKKTLTEVVEKEDSVITLDVKLRDVFDTVEELAKAPPSQLRKWAQELSINYENRDQAASAIWNKE